MSNVNLNNAKEKKNDEFYTLMEDIEKELPLYKKHFEGKVVYCNCDNPNISNFFKYFVDNFSELKIKKLYATGYRANSNGIKGEYDGTTVKITEMNGNGSFCSEEALELFEESDIIVTNPPFSLWRLYFEQVQTYNKKFLILGSILGIVTEKAFPYLVENKVWVGQNIVKRFRKPDGSYQDIGNVMWFTNLEFDKQYTKLNLSKHFSPEEYPKIDNSDIINVNKSKDIPIDYDGIMAVPVSFLRFYNPNEYELLGGCFHKQNGKYDLSTPKVNGKDLFKRLAIRRRA